MLFSPIFTRYYFNSCVSAILAASICVMPLQAQELDACAKSSFGKHALAKHIKSKIKGFLEEAESFDSETSIRKVRKFIRSFRHYASNVIRRDIGGDELYDMVAKKLDEHHVNYDPSILKSLFMSQSQIESYDYVKNTPSRILTGKLSKLIIKYPKVSKSIKNGPYPKDDVIDDQIIIGGVLIACSVLIGIIGLGCPFVAPFTTNAATAVGGVGAGFVASGMYTTSQSNANKGYCVNKSLFPKMSDLIDDS